MTGLMTQDKGLAYVSDAISQAQLRLYKTYAKAPRRTALVIAFSLLKALVVLGWLVTRQKAGVFSFAPAQASQFEVSQVLTPCLCFNRQWPRGASVQQLEHYKKSFSDAVFPGHRHS